MQPENAQLYPSDNKPRGEKRRRFSMKRLIRRVFLVVALIAVVFLGIRFAPNIYARLFGNGNMQWISERFSETLKEKNQLVVYEVETTGQETVTQDAWLLGTVQKVVVPYTFQMSFTVDLSKAVVSAEGSAVQVRVPSPEAGYQKLTVDEAQMKKSDWLYPLTPERYAQIQTRVEAEQFDLAKNNAEYQDSAWNITVKNLENLFKSVVENSDMGAYLTVSVIRDDSLGQATEASAAPGETTAPPVTAAPAAEAA